MKLLFLILTGSLMTLSGPLVLGQDADPYLRNILAAQRDDHVYIRWTISAGNTCDGTIIERKNAEGAYEKIDEIPGVCGSPDQDITYEVIDSQPYPNRVNTYRLLLGLLGYTSPIPVEVILLNEEGYSIQPNPISDEGLFLFENPDGRAHEFCIVDTQGKLIMTIHTNENKIQLDGSRLGSGTYIFKLRQNENLKATGKIVVL